MADDAELLRRYATDRSEEAFATLVQRHLPLVYQAAFRRVNGDAHRAEDVAQAVFTKLARNAGALQRHAVLAGWLYVATRHAAANAMRTEQRRKAREGKAVAMSETMVPAPSAAEWERLRPELDLVMDELSEADRDAVLLRFFGDRPYAEIAANFRISEDAARMRVDRALEKLRAALGRRGVTSTAAALSSLLAAQSALGAPAGLAAAVTGSALAQATVTGSASLIVLMTANKIMTGIVGIALVAGGSAIYELQENRRAAAAITGLNREREALQARMLAEASGKQKAEDRARRAEARLAELARTGNAGTPAASKGKEAGTPVGAAQVANPSPGKKDILYANPEYVRLALKRYAAEIPLQYAAFYRQLGLNSRQVHDFEALLVERQQAMYDVFAAARANGMSVDDPTLLKLKDPAAAGNFEQLKAVLGEAGVAAFQEFSNFRNGVARSQLVWLSSNLSRGAAPLTGEQAMRLAKVIAANVAEPPAGGYTREVGPTNWNAVYAQAQGILSPEQLALVKATNESTELSQQLSKLSDRLLQEAGTAAPKD